MARLSKIGNKLLISYLIVIIITFMVTGITFNFLVQRYLISEAKQQLRIEGQSMADSLKKIPLTDVHIDDKLLTRRQLKIAGRFIDSKLIVFNRNNRILYTNLEKEDRKVLSRMAQRNNLSLKGYVTEHVPIIAPNGDLKGHIFLLTELKDLHSLRSIMNRTQFVSLIVASIFAITIGWILQRSLTQPIQKLMESMSNFSVKDHQDHLDIKTGDEIEELAKCFSSMINRIKGYDAQQKKFLQNTSHELKTPLMSIQGYAEAIKDGIVEGKEIHESLEIIVEESQKLKKIVDELIYLVKLDHIDETFHFQKIMIQEIIEQAIKSIKPLADSKNIEIMMDGDWHAEGNYDKEKLERAMINILGNAVRYAEKTISISCSVLNKHIEITIHDDGMGFKAGEEEKIFERFYKGINGNTGLGLPITKAIIEGHKGHIRAYNHTPKGAVFQITLPTPDAS